MAFSQRLKELLLKKNMTSSELANATGLSSATIYYYLQGKKEPRGRQSIAIAKALNVSLDELWETGFNKASKNEKPLIIQQAHEYIDMLSVEQTALLLPLIKHFAETNNPSLAKSLYIKASKSIDNSPPEIKADVNGLADRLRNAPKVTSDDDL